MYASFLTMIQEKKVISYSRVSSFLPQPQRMADLEVIKLFHAQLSMNFIMLINVKMPTFVGILTFISRVNTTSECITIGQIFIFKYLSFCEQLNFDDKLGLACKKFIISRIGWKTLKLQYCLYQLFPRMGLYDKTMLQLLLLTLLWYQDKEI